LAGDENEPAEGHAREASGEQSRSYVAVKGIVWVRLSTPQVVLALGALTKEGNAHVNEAYGDSDVTLDVDVEGGVGEINLKVV
jgi:hypothetical protein